MQSDLTAALKVKSSIIEFMRERVYGGEPENPRVNPDAAGAFHYADRKIKISCVPSHRDGWLDCAVAVWLVRRRWPFEKLDLVFDAGYGVELEVFRQGRWVNYITGLANSAAEALREREAELRREEIEKSNAPDPNFTPVDDSGIFD